jgi:Flp pilus assembly protein TadB
VTVPARATNRLERAVPARPPRRRPAVASRDAVRERRRRELHFRRRRRDLLQDGVLGLLLAIVLLSVTAGLGVLALIEIIVAVTALGAMLIPRGYRRWRSRARR